MSRFGSVAITSTDTGIPAPGRPVGPNASFTVGLADAGRAEQDDVTEDEVREALTELDPLWDELFPAEQARIVHALVERVVIGLDGADIRMRVDGLAGLVRDLGAMAPAARRAA